MSIFTNRYKRRIQITLLKAKLKLVDIEREQKEYERFKNAKGQCDCIMKKGDLKPKIELLDSLLKGKEIEF